VEKTNRIELPASLRGRSIHLNVIPTVCNLKNMLRKLVEVEGDLSQLKQWEKRSFKAYQIETIKEELLGASEIEQKKIIRRHILSRNPKDFGASCINIYMVAFVAETFGAGKDIFFRFVRNNGISEKTGSAQAIWQVGKGDGVFLDILHKDGTVKDWDFMQCWVKGTGEA
jgi:hypothetical protein